MSNDKKDIVDDTFEIDDNDKSVLFEPIVPEDVDEEAELGDLKPPKIDMPADEPTPNESPNTNDGQDDLFIDIPEEKLDQNVELNVRMITPKEKSEDEYEYPFSLPTRMVPADNNVAAEGSEQETDWDGYRKDSYKFVRETLNKALTKPGTLWKQGIHVEGEKTINIRKGILKNNPDRELTLADLDTGIRAHISTGGRVQIPLVNSGFYVTLEPPKDTTLVNFYTRFVQEKQIVGNESYGAIYSQLGVFTDKMLFDLCVSQIVSTNIKSKMSKLRGRFDEIIDMRDLNLLAWGLAVSLWPSGHEIVRACDQSRKCRNIEFGKVNLLSMVVFDNASFTDDEIKMLLNKRPNSVTLKDVKTYQKNMREKYKKVVDIEANDVTTTFEFSSCSMGTYFGRGEAWIESMKRLAEEALGASNEFEKRDELMISLAEACAMTSYSHIVKRIDTTRGYAATPATVSKTLELLSSSRELQIKFLKKAEEYLNLTSNYVVGVENRECPNCGKPQNDRLGLIPIDSASAFFTMTGIRAFV